MHEWADITLAAEFISGANTDLKTLSDRYVTL